MFGTNETYTELIIIQLKKKNYRSSRALFCLFITFARSVMNAMTFEEPSKQIYIPYCFFFFYTQLAQFFIYQSLDRLHRRMHWCATTLGKQSFYFLCFKIGRALSKCGSRTS